MSVLRSGIISGVKNGSIRRAHRSNWTMDDALGDPIAGSPGRLARFHPSRPVPPVLGVAPPGHDELRELESMVMSGLDRNPLIRGANGPRKIRVPDRGSGRGKSGGYRVFYLYIPRRGLVLLLDVIDKSERANPSVADRNAYAEIIRRLQQIYDREIP